MSRTGEFYRRQTGLNKVAVIAAVPLVGLAAIAASNSALLEGDSVGTAVGKGIGKPIPAAGSILSDASDGFREGAGGNPSVDVSIGDGIDATLNGDVSTGSGTMTDSELESRLGGVTVTTDAVGSAAVGKVIDPANDTLWSAAVDCGLDVSGDNQDVKIEAAAQALAGVNDRFAYSGNLSWQNWDLSGPINCPQ